jgi:hypothetical protein
VVASSTMSRPNPIRAAIDRLMAALDRASAAQREVEAARAALDRAATQSELRIAQPEPQEVRRD